MYYYRVAFFLSIESFFYKIWAKFLRFSFNFYCYEFLEKKDSFLFFLLNNTSRSYIEFMVNTVNFFHHAQNFMKSDSLSKWDNLMTNISLVHDIIIKKNLDLILYPIRGNGEFYLDERKIFNKVQPYTHNIELEFIWSAYPTLTVFQFWYLLCIFFIVQKIKVLFLILL